VNGTRSRNRGHRIGKRSSALLLAAVLVAGCGSRPSSLEPGSTTPTNDDIRGTFEVAGHELFIECRGQGEPTVLMLHGAFGASSSDWLATQTSVPEARTCAYDRRNVAHSDTVPGPNTAQIAIDDLHGLLETAGIEPPYVLVGHSYGGMLSLLYAGTYPEEVRAILLVDATMPFEVDLDPPGVEEQVKSDLNDNPEHIDFYGTFAAAAAATEYLPAIPVTFMFATQQDYSPDWEDGAYEEALNGFMDNLPDGKVLEYDTTHEMPTNMPDEIATQIRAIIAQSETA
jgi:pimeloyl-ACP methyl ester carboxylesterase